MLAEYAFVCICVSVSVSVSVRVSVSVSVCKFRDLESGSSKTRVLGLERW